MYIFFIKFILRRSHSYLLFETLEDTSKCNWCWMKDGTSSFQTTISENFITHLSTYNKAKQYHEFIILFQNVVYYYCS